METTLLLIAGLGALAIGVSRIVKRFVPEIVVFLALGVLIGPDGPVRLINSANVGSLNLVTQVALGAIIFRIGDRLRVQDLKGARRLLIPLNLGQLLLTGGAVFIGTLALGADVDVALLLAIIASETGVLTVTATISELRAEGTLTRTLLSSVALSNVAVAALFGVAFPFILAASGEASGLAETARVFAVIVAGSILIGLVCGRALKAFASSIESSGELLMLLMVVVTGMVGAAIYSGASVVASTLIAGLYIANAAPWVADRLFAAIGTIEAPIYLIFFIVAGAGIHLDELTTFGLLGAAYVVARAAGKLLGSALGGLAGGGRAGALMGARTGLGLLPHAGMAIALVAFVVEQAPGLGERVSTIVLGSIVVFELLGPLFTRAALRQSGEVNGGDEQPLAGELGLRGAHAFQRVLVPIGARATVLPRLGFLLDLIASMEAELVAVHVSPPGGERVDGRPEILRLVEAAAAERGVACRSVHATSEQIAHTLVTAAEEHAADLIIMGEPSRIPFLEQTSWGQVAQRVIRDASVPVLVYPVDPEHPGSVPDIYRLSSNV